MKYAEGAFTGAVPYIVLFLVRIQNSSGTEAFSQTSIEELEFPDTLGELCQRCFHQCGNLRRVVVRESSMLVRVGC